MASNYHLLVKKSLDRNKTECFLLPEYIQRGWKRMYRSCTYKTRDNHLFKGIYTSEEKELLKRSYIIAPDTQIPNSVVRYRLGTKEMFKREKTKLLQKAFDLPEELFSNLAAEHQCSKSNDEEKLSFQWTDEDDNYEMNGKKSPKQTVIDRQREKRRKLDEYKYDRENLEPLSLEEIIEEIQTNIGKDLKDEDVKIIAELMQIINQRKKNQIMNIYDELTSAQLISQFGGVPKLVQALQDTQKAFERVAMKTNIASIETVINVLLEKDNTYRIAVELLKSFNDNTKKNKLQQNLYLIDRSDDITDHDHTVFNILIKDRISRLPISDLTMLIRDLGTVRTIGVDKLKGDRDEQVKYLSEQLDLIFTRGHLDGIKTTFDTLKSPTSVSLREFIEKIETSIKMKLTEKDSVLIESYIHDYLSTLNENELRIINERLAQQGTLKRLTDFHELNQAITMGLMKKIDTDGLSAVIENIKDAQIDIYSFTELVQVLTLINQYIQQGSSIPLEQIQKQLDMAYFIETRNLNPEEIYELSKAIDLYSIAHIPLSEQPTAEECAIFLENLQVPFIRTCLQRTLETINEENITDLNKVSHDFYKKHVSKFFNEIIRGSDELNQSLSVNLIREQLKKSKELPDKVYRQMLKDELIQANTKVKIDTDKKKISAVLDGINQILIHEKDSTKQAQLLEVFDRVDVSLPERVKQWYKKKSPVRNSPMSTSKTKKNTSKQKGNVKTPVSKTKAIKPRPLFPSHPPTKKSQRGSVPTANTSPTKKTVVKSTKETLRNSIPPKPKDESKTIIDTSPEQPIAPPSPPFILQETSKSIQDINDQRHPESDELPSSENSQSFQADLEIIQPQTATDGTMGTNRTISFDFNQTAAYLQYQSLLAIDPKQEIQTRQSNQKGEIVHEPPYEKTKAQRILAKTIPRSTSETDTKTEPIPSESESLPNQSSKIPRRSLTKSLKQTEDIYINSLTTSLNSLLTQSKYDNVKLRKIHEELISSGLISPLNDFYRSTNDALRVILDHCITYDEFIKWTLSLLQTTNKPNLIDFAHDLYSIAIDLDLALIDRIDDARCAIEIQENLKHDLQNISEHNLREINSYINANQFEKVLHTSKKLNVTSKDRMLSDLNSLLLHLIQSCHSFKTKYRPMQTYIRDISEIFQSRAVADLARKLDELEKKLSKTFGITFFGLSQRLHDSHFLLIK